MSRTLVSMDAVRVSVSFEGCLVVAVHSWFVVAFECAIMMFCVICGDALPPVTFSV